MGQLLDQAIDGQVKMVGMGFDQMFKKHQDADPHRESLVFEQLPGPGQVAGFLADHGEDVVHVAHVEEIGDDGQQFLVADSGCGG